MLELYVIIAIGVLVAAGILLISRAPRDRRKKGALLLFVPLSIGLLIGYVVAPDEATRIYSPMAGGIFGFVIGAIAFDKLRKK